MAEQFDSSRPIYAQLVERLKAKILAGIYPNTMQRALAQLENEGLVRTERTAGRYVTEDRALIEQLRAEAARNLTAEFLEKMRGIGYGPEQAAALLERWNEKEETNHD